MKKTIKALLATLALSGFAGAAQATLIGDEVGCNITGGGSFSCDTANNTVVDPGVEFFVGGGQFISVDISAASVALNFLNTGSLGGTIINLTDLDWVGMPLGEITGIELTSNSGVNGLTAGDLSFGAHNISINLIGTNFSQGATALISLATSQHVPEPATLGLLGLGLAGLGLARRKKA